MAGGGLIWLWRGKKSPSSNGGGGVRPRRRGRDKNGRPERFARILDPHVLPPESNPHDWFNDPAMRAAIFGATL